MANTTRLPPPHSMNAQETSSAPRLANESRPTPTSGACRVPHPQASTTSIVHSATTEHGTLKYSRPPRQSWLHSDIPFRLISTEIVGPFKASPWSPRPRENKAAQSNAAKAQLAAPLPSTHLNDLKITATLASQASSNKTTVTAAIIMNQELPSVKASTSGYKARRRTLGSGCLAQMKQLTSPVNAATFDKVPSPKKRTSASVATLDGLPVRTNSAEVITTAESLTPPPTPHRTAVSVPTPVPQTTLIGITASVSRRADANASDDSQTAINGNSVVKGCAVTTSVATNASGLRKLTAYAPPALPVRPGPRMMSVSDVQPILATHSHQKNPPRLATFSARRSAAKLTMHRRRSSVPNVPYYYKSNGKIQMTLPLVSRNPTTPITSGIIVTQTSCMKLVGQLSVANMSLCVTFF
ncbi:hypothetical protein EDD21DRAFT_109504 [Dissophora ornata]|nr:hypothetical protein EDD21DRAFT_109504 [Dissophora ornata]